jgi:hypothetical protein
LFRGRERSTILHRIHHGVGKGDEREGECGRGTGKEDSGRQREDGGGKEGRACVVCTSIRQRGCLEAAFPSISGALADILRLMPHFTCRGCRAPALLTPTQNGIIWPQRLRRGHQPTHAADAWGAARWRSGTPLPKPGVPRRHSHCQRSHCPPATGLPRRTSASDVRGALGRALARSATQRVMGDDRMPVCPAR